MPTKRRRRLATAIVPMSESEWKFLMDEPDEIDPWTSYFLRFDISWAGDTHGALSKLWDAHGALVLAEWTEARPGTRPSTWWRLSAPRIAPGRFPDCYYDGQLEEPREFLGGAGCPDYEALNIVPHFWLGVPSSWLNFDPDDPPTFKSQAQYLERHGLLLARERRQLGANAFDPEVLEYPSNPLDRAYGEHSEVQARIKAYGARAVFNINTR